MIPVFWTEPSDRVRVALRRFTHASDKRCRASEWGHDASTVIAENDPAARWNLRDDGERGSNGYHLDPDADEVRWLVTRDDPRWPTACAHCGEPFQRDDPWQVACARLYVRRDTGALFDLRDIPVGGMYDATWYHDVYPYWCGADGIALMVRTPGGTWHVDGEASNCTRKGDHRHKCWVRHGDPRDPQGRRTGQPLHVDKRGDTCAAGAGSIISGRFHGFLHHGRLTNA